MMGADRRLFNRHSIRLTGYDYRSEGAYFVTICAFQQKPQFGEIRDGKVHLNELGALVQNLWFRIGELRAEVELDTFVVMPNHLHGILFFVAAPGDHSCSDHFDGPAITAKTLPSKSLGAVLGQFKSAVTKQSRRLSNPPSTPIWQRNYHEHIIRNERALNEIREYIMHNPARWHDDELYAD